MVFKDGPNKGQAKGLKQVCLERFGEEAIRGLKHDGLQKLLEKEADFRFIFRYVLASFQETGSVDLVR